MLEYRKDLRTQTNTPTAASMPTRRAFVAPSASRATTAQASGHARLNSLARSLSLSASSLPSPPPIPLETHIRTEAEKEEAKRRAVIEDEGIVDRELMNYETDGVIDENHSEFEDFDILRYWQVRLLFKQTNY
jgi:hypothetical protein